MSDWESNSPSVSNSPSTHKFPENWRGKGFVDLRRLDAAGARRGPLSNGGERTGQEADDQTFEEGWKAATTAYQLPPSYSSFPTDLKAYIGLEDAFGD